MPGRNCCHRKLKLMQGDVALVDAEDYERVAQYSWWVKAHPKRVVKYAAGKVGNKLVTLHRFILNAPKGKQVDHKNHNGLDNRRSNLRLCSHSQNIHRRNMMKVNKTSKYKGVHRYKNGNCWCSAIRVDGKRMFLGYFDCEKEAARKYNAAAKKHFGEFAWLNQI